MKYPHGTRVAIEGDELIVITPKRAWADALMCVLSGVAAGFLLGIIVSIPF